MDVTGSGDGGVLADPESRFSRITRGRGQELGELPAGGVYASVNVAVYHYGGNNPLVMRDTDGRHNRWWEMSAAETQYQVDQRQARGAYFANKRKEGAGNVNSGLQAGNQLFTIANRSSHYKGETREPVGGITMLLGASAQAGAGGGGDLTSGFAVVLDYSDLSVSLGAYTSSGVGTQFGAGIGGKLEVLLAQTIDPQETLDGRSLVIGGAANVIPFVSAGMDAAIPLEDGGVSLIGGTLSFGVSTPFEGHMQHTTTTIDMNE